MRTNGSIRPFPDPTQFARAFSTGCRLNADHVTAALIADPVERDRALLSLMLAGEPHAWVRGSPPVAPPPNQHGGRRHAILSWQQELDILAALEAQARDGQPVTPLDVVRLMSERAGRPVGREVAYVLLRRHGFLLTRSKRHPAAS